MNYQQFHEVTKDIVWLNRPTHSHWMHANGERKCIYAFLADKMILFSARKRISSFLKSKQINFLCFPFLPFKSCSSYSKLQAFAHAATCTCCSENGTPRRTTASNGKAFFLIRCFHFSQCAQMKRYGGTVSPWVAELFAALAGKKPWDDVMWWKTWYKCPERIRLCSSPCLLQINKIHSFIHSFRSVRLFFILIKINVLIHLKNYSI